ncbi:MAG: biopolymer transporter ExbD [Candidatus Competibacteraceae bacterium]|nr:biopolymer transporter ExbD [Candidatus Competibacteraceae bacterium]
MKLRHIQRIRDEEAGIIPLINVVFLLLIFFMIAGQLSSPDALVVDPPSSREAGPARKGPLTLLIDRQGRLALEGSTLEEAQLASALGQRLSEEGAGTTVRIKADARLEAGRLIEVMDRLREAGAEELLLLTTGGGG